MLWNKSFLSTATHQGEEVGCDLQAPQQSGQEDNGER